MLRSLNVTEYLSEVERPVYRGAAHAARGVDQAGIGRGSGVDRGAADGSCAECGIYDGGVSIWPRRRRPRAAGAPTLSRSASTVTAKVELADLTPDPVSYLGQAAYLELALFEDVGRAIVAAPSTMAKSALSRVASPHLLAHEGLVAELRRRGADPATAMEPYRRGIDDFQRRTAGQDWYEILVTCYVTAGFLTDFFLGLAAGLPRDLRERVASLLDVEAGEEVLVAELRAAIDGNPRLASRLAMWGRRLVGDTMLVARAALGLGRASTVAAPPREDRIEPVFTELIAAHTRRMDALGLTA